VSKYPSQKRGDSSHTPVFFYGTLLVPAVVARVLGRECSDLTFKEAILPVGLRHPNSSED
jgi:hypothetical protein